MFFFCLGVLILMLFCVVLFFIVNDIVWVDGGVLVVKFVVCDYILVFLILFVVVNFGFILL